jgi:hypothetical protein
LFDALVLRDITGFAITVVVDPAASTSSTTEVKVTLSFGVLKVKLL